MGKAYLVFSSVVAFTLGVGVARLIRPGRFIDGAALTGAPPPVESLGLEDVSVP